MSRFQHDNNKLRYVKVYQLNEGIPCVGINAGEVIVQDAENNLYVNRVIGGMPVTSLELMTSKQHPQKERPHNAFFYRDYFVWLTRIEHPENPNKDSEVARQFLFAKKRVLLYT